VNKLQFLKNKNILICGATGLVGTNTLLKLKDVPGVKVRAVYHSRKPQVISKNIVYVKADLTDFNDCVRITKGIDYVIMVAAKIARRDPGRLYLVPNILMSMYMLEAAYKAGVKKYVWLSSATAYPPVKRKLKESDMFSNDPHDAYYPIGWATRYIETLCKMYAKKVENPMTTIVLRSSAIYGEYDDFEFETCQVLPALIRKVVERQNPIEIWGTGSLKRDCIYVKDVVDACLKALNAVDGFTVLNIGLGKSYSVKELLYLILDIDNYDTANIVCNKKKVLKKLPSIEIDCTKAKHTIGFMPSYTIKEGLANTIAWYRSYRRSGDGVKKN